MDEKKPGKDFRCGFVSIIGRPNVGKSTLLNAIVGEKVAIVSKVPQTTRNQIRGIYNDERGQIIFIDTPGLVLGRDKLDHCLRNASLSTMADVDCIIHVVDASEPTGLEEQDIVRRLQNLEVPVILGLNKIDLKGKFVPQYLSLWEKVTGKPVQELKSFTILPLSGKEETNVAKLIDILYEFLPQGVPLYPTDTVTDTPQKIVIADTIREKLLRILRQEVPHSIAVYIEEIQPRQNKVLYIRAQILVERDSQKQIVIGQKGQVLKKVGSEARAELEDLLETKVFLEMNVKAKEGWRDDSSVLEDMGYEF